MRDILFRGKGISTKRWHYGTYERKIFDERVPSPDDINRPYRAAEMAKEVAAIAKEIKHYILVNNSKGKIIEREIYPETLGQYVEKLDAGDSLVFEGDIVQDKNNYDIFGVIVWNEENAEFVIDCEGDYIDMEYTTDFYVIGNITDNPEMAAELL